MPTELHPKSPEAWLFLLFSIIALSVALGQTFAWFVGKLHEWRNERAIRQILERDDEPPYAI
jgi:hypothetical protein